MAYVVLALWLVVEPYRSPMEPFEKQLVPILLVVMPVLAILAGALTALVLTTGWWFCWASWHPHASEMPAGSEASDVADQPRLEPGGSAATTLSAQATAPAHPGHSQRRALLRASRARSGRHGAIVVSTKADTD